MNIALFVISVYKFIPEFNLSKTQKFTQLSIVFEILGHRIKNSYFYFNVDPKIQERSY